MALWTFLEFLGKFLSLFMSKYNSNKSAEKVQKKHDFTHEHKVLFFKKKYCKVFQSQYILKHTAFLIEGTYQMGTW